jgi:hypothetical protein
MASVSSSSRKTTPFKQAKDALQLAQGDLSNAELKLSRAEEEKSNFAAALAQAKDPQLQRRILDDIDDVKREIAEPTNPSSI